MSSTKTKADYLARIEEEREHWQRLVAKIDQTWMEEPGPMGDWNFKDLAAHITGWRERTIARFEAAGRGEEVPPPPWPDHLVEDDEQTREATARFLRAAGHIVQTYSSASEFLASPHAEGCVLLDLQLPGANGLQVQQQLAAEEEPLPVVFLSAHADVSDSVQAMKHGAVDFLTKTTDGGVLLNAISRAPFRSPS